MSLPLDRSTHLILRSAYNLCKYKCSKITKSKDVKTVSVGLWTWMGAKENSSKMLDKTLRGMSSSVNYLFSFWIHFKIEFLIINLKEIPFINHFNAPHQWIWLWLLIQFHFSWVHHWQNEVGVMQNYALTYCIVLFKVG